MPQPNERERTSLVARSTELLWAFPVQPVNNSCSIAHTTPKIDKMAMGEGTNHSVSSGERTVAIGVSASAL